MGSFLAFWGAALLILKNILASVCKSLGGRGSRVPCHTASRGAKPFDPLVSRIMMRGTIEDLSPRLPPLHTLIWQMSIGAKSKRSLTKPCGGLYRLPDRGHADETQRKVEIGVTH